MARRLAQYRDQLLVLLPRGAIWSQDGELADYCQAIAEEFRRLEFRAELLVEESDPRTVFELIDEWEKDWGLPDACLGALPLLPDRRDVLTNKIVNIANQSRQTYINRAAKLGYTITVTEYSSGDAIPGHPEIPIADAAYAVQINSALDTILYRHCGDPCGEPFASWDNLLLECSLKAIQQSHQLLLFSYA